MYAKAVNLGMPVFDKPAGFDLMLGDWVSPHGKGMNSDIIFTGHLEKRAEDDTDYTLTVSFPKTGHGIQEFRAPLYYLHSRGSELRSAEIAPADGYAPNWVQIRTRRPGKPPGGNHDLERNYYFRVRTVVDDKGNIVRAQYGKIYGDFMHFNYYLNPTPNSRDVEFDPKHNLIKNLSSLDEVREP